MLRVTTDGEGPGVRRLVEALTREAVKDLLRNLRHNSEVQRRIATGELDQQAVNAAYLRYAREHGAEYRDALTRATVDYYALLSDLSTRYSERFYEHVLSGAVTDADDGRGDDGGIRTFPVELHGPPGREVVGRFTVQNPEDHATETLLRVTPCDGPDGQTFVPPLTVHPATLRLDAMDEREVTLRLALLPSVFLPGQLYRCRVVADGPEPFQLDVVMWMDDPDAGLVNPVAADAVRDRPADTRAGPGGVDRAGDGSGDGTATDGAGADADVEDDTVWVTRCPACRRTFERDEPTSRLYRHKTPDGDDCPERVGLVEHG